MGIEVSVARVEPRRMAAVRRQVAAGGIGAVWRPALDQVWDFLRRQPGLRTDGHNIFLYQHAARAGEPMNVDFGVEVARSFAPSGEVYETQTPAGEAAIAVHHGPYDQLHGAHEAIRTWLLSSGRTLAGYSWEIYGDWSEDPAKLETTVIYLLA